MCFSHANKYTTSEDFHLPSFNNHIWLKKLGCGADLELLKTRDSNSSVDTADNISPCSSLVLSQNVQHKMEHLEEHQW